MGEVVEITKFAEKPRTKIIPDVLTVTTFAEAKKIFILNCRAKNLSKRTVVWYESKLLDFEKFLLAHYPGLSFDAISTQVVRHFVCVLHERSNQRIKDKPLSSYTISGIVKVLRVFFNSLFEEGYLQVNPCEKISMPRVQKKVIQPLIEEDIRRLLVMPDRKSFTGFRDYVMMLLFLDTGLRLSELLNANLSDVDWGRFVLRVLGKGNREREVPFGAGTARVLVKYIKWREKNASGTELLFVTREGGRLKSRRVQFKLRQYGKRAGIEKLHPHRLRHTAALHWIVSGGDILSLQRLLGHSSLDMVRNYVALNVEEVRAKHRQFGLVDKMGLSEGLRSSHK